MITVRRFGTQTWGLTSSGYSKILFALCSSKSAASIPGMRWDPTERTWFGYADAVGIVIDKARHHGERVEGAVIAAEPTTLVRVPALKGLFEYQKEAVNFLLAHANEGAISGLDLGLGKSAVSLRIARAYKGECAVAVCPAFVANVWERECAKWWPEAHPALVLKGTKPNAEVFASNPKPKLVVCNYSILHAWADVLVASNYRVVFLDEAHWLQGRASRRVDAVRKLRATAIAMVAMTGTPMPNRTRDLWLLTDILSPGRFGKFFDYGRRYCEGHQVQVTPDKAVWDFNGSSNVEELHARLNHFMFRRTKKQVAAELPLRTRQIIELDVKKTNYATSMLIQNGKINQRLLRAQLDAAADRKLPQVAEIIADHVSDEQHTVVCFTYRRVIAEAIVDLLTSAGVVGARFVHGGLTQAKRQEIIDSHPRVLTATIDSTGVGIDLSYADVAVFAELTYEPHELAQAEGRLHRRGQRKNVLIQYLIARGSADELIKDAVITKMITQEAVVGDADDELLTDMRGGVKTTEEVLDELAERLMKGAT